jgi:hypothetical protein
MQTYRCRHAVPSDGTRALAVSFIKLNALLKAHDTLVGRAPPVAAMKFPLIRSDPVVSTKSPVPPVIVWRSTRSPSAIVRNAAAFLTVSVPRWPATFASSMIVSPMTKTTPVVGVSADGMIAEAVNCA